MATTKNIVELQINASGAIDSVGKLGTAFDNAVAEGQSLRTQLKNLQKELATLDPKSDRFQELSVQAGELRDKMNDASEAIRANAGPAIESLGNNAALLKDKLFNLDFVGVGESLKGIGTSVGRISGKDITEGIKSVTSGFVSLGKALLSNPIFLLAGTIALVVANFQELSTLIDGVTDAEQQRLEVQKDAAALSKEQLDAISAQENILKLQGKSEREILDLKIKAAQQAIIDQEAVIKTGQIQTQQQIAAAQRNKDILSGILEFVTAPIKVLLQGIDSIGSAFGQNFGLVETFTAGIDSIASLVFNPEEVKAEADKTLKEQEAALLALKNQQAGFQLQVNQIDKQASDARIEQKKKEAEELRKIEENITATTLALREKIRQDSAREATNQRSKLLTGEEEKFKVIEEQEAIRQQFLLSQQEKEIAAVDAKYIELRKKAKGNAELSKLLAEQNAAEVAAIEQKYEQQKLDAKIGFAEQTLGVISNINDAFNKGNEASARRAFAINKGVAIADALIQTYKGASAAFANAAANPATVLFPGYPAIQAGFAIASGLAQVAKIRSQQFQGGGSGGGSSSVGSAPSIGGGTTGGGVPQFNPINTNFLQNRPDQLTPKAFVIAGEVSSQTEARQKVQDLARL